MTEFQHIGVSEARPGVKVKADGGFTCMPAGVIRTIRRDTHREMYVHCNCGRHYLDDQERGAEDGYQAPIYIGFQLYSLAA